MRWILWTLALIVLVVLFVSGAVLTVLASRGKDFLVRRVGTLKMEKRTPIDDTGVYIIDSITLKDSRGMEVKGFLRIPHGEGPFPAVVLLAGLNTGRESLEWVMDVPETRHVAFLTLDYPYQGKTQFENIEFLRNLGPIYDALFDGVNAGIYAQRYLAKLPEIDSDRIFIVGVSFGAFYSIVSGALDPNFAMVGVFFGGADFAALLDHNMARQGILKLAPIRWAASRIAAMVLHPLEPMEWIGKIAPRPVLMINGTQDASIPEEYATELFRAAGNPKKLVWIDSKHIDQQGPAIVGELISVSAAWLDSMGLLEPVPEMMTP
jgi:pimeloyl-ACP methyl ester carboxylesterase